MKKIIIAINIPFKWCYGGDIVYLTGTFTNWTNHILMNKIINEFQYILVSYKPTQNL